MLTVAALIGGDPIVTGRVWNCDGAPPAVVFANQIELLRDPGVTLVDVQYDDPELELARIFQLVIPAAELTPALFGLPVEFDLEFEVFCGGIWVRSPPFPMIYVPTAASLAPPFQTNRFWPADDSGSLLVCEDSELVHYVGAVTATDRFDLGFACGVTDLSNGLGFRRYLAGVSLGIAAIDPGPALAWTRPMIIDDWWAVIGTDPVVVRQEAGAPVIAVLDQNTGLDLHGPRPYPGLPPFRPANATYPLGAVARDTNGEILVLESQRTDNPDSLTYRVHRFTSDLSPLGAVTVVVYDWRIPTSEAIFVYDQTATHAYLGLAPNETGPKWIDKVHLTAGAVVWSTNPDDGWRFPLGDGPIGTVVASDRDFAWLDIDTGALISARFAPDSGNRFLRGLVEADGSIILIADPAGGVAQGLYIFAPDGTSTLRFHPGAAILRWLAPGWGEGSLVSFFSELHWLHSRATYAAMLQP